jgi:hypothetical protein
VVSLTGPEHDELRLGLYLWGVGLFAAGVGTGWYFARRRRRRRRAR